jgi:lysophospholipase L1-like esterase
VGRTWNIALTVLAVAEIGAAVYVVQHNDTPTTPAASPRTTPVVQTSSPAPSGGVQASSTAAHTSPVVAFLGDDWTRGTGATEKPKRFTTLLCAQLGAQERNFGVDGSGYAKSGLTGGPYASRVDQIVAADPQIVVVSGGRNDSSDAPTTAAEAARNLFATLHEKLPGAVLIAVAPFWGDSDLPPEMVALSRAIDDGVTAAGGTYLDITDPIHGHPTYMADAADPNDAGYAAIASALEPLVQPLLPA